MIEKNSIVDGLPYMNEGFVVVPEGVTRICSDAFNLYDKTHEKIQGAKLPSSLVAVEQNAFHAAGGGRIGHPGPRIEVVVPKGVKTSTDGSFYGFDKITVYDSIDADCESASEKSWTFGNCEDLWYGSSVKEGPARSRLGCVSMQHDKDVWFCPHDYYGGDFEVEVRSAETDEVKYRVWMLLGDPGEDKSPCEDGLPPRTVKNMLCSVWGAHASVYFPGIDEAFGFMKWSSDKLLTAVYRLRWPIDLADEMRGEYEALVAKKAKVAAQVLISNDDVEGLKRFEQYGIIKKGNLAGLLYFAEDGIDCSMNLPSYGWANFSSFGRAVEGDAAPACAEYLRAYKQEVFKGRVSKPKDFINTLVEGATVKMRRKDPSGWFDRLRDQPVMSADPEKVQELFNATALVRNPAAVEEYFEIFGKAEFLTEALCVSIFEGNKETALALCRHGADLSCSFTPTEFENDTPEAIKQRAAINRRNFSFGLGERDGAYLRTLYRSSYDTVGHYPGRERCVSETIQALYEEGFLSNEDMAGLFAVAEKYEFHEVMEVASRFI